MQPDSRVWRATRYDRRSMAAAHRPKPLTSRAFAGIWNPTILGAAIVVLMALACLGSLPYTLARINVTQPNAAASGETGSSRRFEAINPEAALLPPTWAPKTADEIHQLQALAQVRGRTFSSAMGTDRLGRSVFARCLAGGGISLCIGLSAAALAVVIGTIYGAIAGYCGGRVDSFLMRIVDVLYGLPYILLVVLLAVAVNGVIERIPVHNQSHSEWFAGLLRLNKEWLQLITLLVAIGGVSWLTLARVIRGQVLSLKQQPFMEACRAIGVPVRKQFTRHLLPNLLGPIIVYATLAVPTAILSESFLSFLGIGVQEPLPSWGNLAASGLSELNTVRVRWWLILWPCALIAITLLALNFMGEGLRERYDPKFRTG